MASKPRKVSKQGWHYPIFSGWNFLGEEEKMKKKLMTSDSFKAKFILECFCDTQRCQEIIFISNSVFYIQGGLQESSGFRETTKAFLSNK